MGLYQITRQMNRRLVDVIIASFCKPAAWVILCTPLSAGPAAWLDFEGRIKGESSHAAHIDWIEIEGFSIGGARHSGAPGSFGLTKRLDRATPGILTACASGTRFRHVTLDLARQASAGAFEVPARLELSGVIVQGDEVSATDDVPMQLITLAFESITYTYLADPLDPVAVNFNHLSGSGSIEKPPSDPDSGADCLVDSWETAYFGNLGQGPLDDADGDGINNLLEFQLGTDPKSAGSFFKATLTPVAGATGLYELAWNSVAGKAYLIEWSPDLLTPFTTLRTVTATSAMTIESINNSGAVGFYRVRPR